MGAKRLIDFRASRYYSHKRFYRGLWGLCVVWIGGDGGSPKIA